MSNIKEKLVLLNCKIVTENEVLENKAIVISNGDIENIIDEKLAKRHGDVLINCNGDYILPGLIDIHSDVIEKLIVPRKGVIFDNLIALNEIDRELMAQGITTIYHSISIAESTVCNNKRTLKLDNMFNLCDQINDYNKDLLINHKFHARFELNSINAFEPLYVALCNGRISELSFMDHTPGQGQYRNINVFKKVIQQQYGMVSEKRKLEIIETCLSKPKLATDKMNALIKKANELGIPMAYHDVDSTEQVEWMRNNNIKICEFPLSAAIAQYAFENNLYTIVGAPNIVLGHSHYNNVGASSLILKGFANIICSDYFSPSLLLSLFKLHKDFGLPLHEVIKLASLNPAKAVNIDDKYGSIKMGKKADLIIVNINNSIPNISKVIIDGKIKLEVSM